MYVLVGKTFDGPEAFHTWLVCCSKDKNALNSRLDTIIKRLEDYNCFYSINGPLIVKKSLGYSKCLEIQKILNDTGLDKGCNFISYHGINYDIVEVSETIVDNS